MTFWDWESWTAYVRGVLVLPKSSRLPLSVPTSPFVPRPENDAIPARLDLHGMTLTVAFETFCDAVEKTAPHRRSLLVITGIGALGQSAMRRELPFWVHHPRVSHLIQAWSQAAPHQGGQGAFVLTFKKTRKT